MYEQRGQWREWIQALAQKFREKGATSPERALTAQELDVHERFEQAMKRRLGQTGIFVAVGEKYYLNEERFREFEQRWQSGGGHGGSQRPMGGFFALRILRMVLGTVIILLFVINFLTGRTWDLWYLIIVLAVVWVVVSVLQIFYLARGRTQFR